MNTYLKNNKWTFFTFLIITPIGAAVAVYLSFVLQKIADIAVSKDIQQFIFISIFTLIYIFIDAFMDYGVKISRAKLVQKIAFDVREDILHRLRKEPLSSFEKKGRSSFMSMVTNDLAIIESDYFDGLFFLYYQLFSFIIALIATLVINPLMTIFILVVSLFPILLPYVTRKILAGKKDEVSHAFENYMKNIKEILDGFFVIRFFNAFQRISLRHQKENDHLMKKKLADERARRAVGATSYGLSSVMYLGTWVLGVYFVIKGQIEFSAILAMSQLMVFVSSPLITITEQYTTLIGGNSIFKKVLAFIRSAPKKQSGNRKVEKITHLQVENLSYKLEGKSILQSISFDFAFAKKYAIVGESGSGKSSFLKLLANYDSPTTGKILLNDWTIDDYDSESFYKNVGIVEQQTIVFDASIKDNISLFHEAADEQVIAAMKQAGLEKWLTNSENSLTAPFTKLSGGEQRRMDLARVLLHHPQMIMLDEPTAGLDQQNTLLMENTLLSLENKLLIMSTHHYSEAFLNQFDEILVMKDGRLVEQGSFKALMNKKGHFFNLFQQQ
ncbi:ABC transporter ATP-binding protein [Bacillaceae bacterium Marseille-Q3522]|nr:ABC transporter ATP-binding protein [Bacillaceae bacterium Marseille-Q3522]